MKNEILKLVEAHNGIMSKRLLYAIMSVYDRPDLVTEKINDLINEGKLVHEDRDGYELGAYILKN
jgi:hypothetical protein